MEENQMKKNKKNKLYREYIKSKGKALYKGEISQKKAFGDVYKYIKRKNIKI